MSDDSNWVFESLVSFLRGPVWNVPILTFIENKSLIFEPDCPDDESHRKIYDEYKNLVDFMLSSYMEDIGIAPEQFEEACGKASSKIKSKLHQTLFEQVWAADDYEIFQRMMIQKNLELQLQALELLQKKYGIVPDSFVSGGNLTADEQSVMEEVIKKSLEEHEAYLAGIDKEQQELEMALALSEEEKRLLEGKRNSEKRIMMDALGNRPTERAKSAKPSAPTMSSDANITPEELQKRQAYLRKQRDKLLELKRKEREKQLSAYEESAPQKRPKSSKAAMKAMNGATLDPKTLQIRKALAEKLKAEVIDK